MKILPSRRVQRKPTPPTKSPTDIPEGVIDPDHLPPGAKRVPPISDVFEIMEVSAPKLKRPVLMVHGLAQHADTWASFKTHLTGEPENIWGGVYRSDREAEFQAQLKDKPEAKVFALDISDNLAAPRVVANEVRRALTAIMESTGCSSVDVVTHSMGALVAREARRQGEDGFDNLLMVSPPNQGAYEATMATLFGDSGLYEHYPQEKLGAMDALRLEYDRNGEIRNTWLHELNEFWKQDRDRPRSAIITGIGIPTPDRSLTGVSPGDGMVAARRAPLEGAEFHLAVPNKLAPDDANFRDFQDFRYNHLQIVSEPEVFQVAGEFLSAGEDRVKEKPSFEQQLEATRIANGKAREEIAVADLKRQSLDARQNWGARLSGAGATVAASGIVTALAGLPLVSAGLLGLGGLALGTGAFYGSKNASMLAADSKATVDSAETSLNRADSLIHRYRREIAPSDGVSRDTLRDFHQRTADQRVAVFEADFARRRQVRWQKRGAIIAGVGAAAAASGVLVRSVAPWIGSGLSILGGIGLAGGAVTSVISSENLAESATRASELSKQALKLSTELVDQFAT